MIPGIENTPPEVAFVLGAAMMAAFQKRTTQILDRFWPTEGSK